MRVAMLSRRSLVATVVRLTRDLGGYRIGRTDTFAHSEGDELLIRWQGKVVLRCFAFHEERVSLIPDEVETLWTVEFSTYVGWKLWNMATGCFASKSELEANLTLWNEDTEL